MHIGKGIDRVSSDRELAAVVPSTWDSLQAMSTGIRHEPAAKNTRSGRAVYLVIVSTLALCSGARAIRPSHVTSGASSASASAT